jgi:hypothetical protein
LDIDINEWNIGQSLGCFDIGAEHGRCGIDEIGGTLCFAATIVPSANFLDLLSSSGTLHCSIGRQKDAGNIVVSAVAAMILNDAISAIMPTLLFFDFPTLNGMIKQQQWMRVGWKHGPTLRVSNQGVKNGWHPSLLRVVAHPRLYILLWYRRFNNDLVTVVLANCVKQVQGSTLL